MGTTFPLLVLIKELHRNFPRFTYWTLAVAIFTKVTNLPIQDIFFESFTKGLY